MVKIELKGWSYTCGDGCCSEWGTDILVNGKELEGNGGDVKDTLEVVFKELGINVEITEDYE
jgi:hypothetical protein